jgi:hypothetical protein
VFEPFAAAADPASQPVRRPCHARRRARPAAPTGRPPCTRCDEVGDVRHELAPDADRQAPGGAHAGGAACPLAHSGPSTHWGTCMRDEKPFLANSGKTLALLPAASCSAYVHSRLEHQGCSGATHRRLRQAWIMTQRSTNGHASRARHRGCIQLQLARGRTGIRRHRRGTVQQPSLRQGRPGLMYGLSLLINMIKMGRWAVTALECMPCRGAREAAAGCSAGRARQRRPAPQPLQRRRRHIGST